MITEIVSGGTRMANTTVKMDQRLKVPMGGKNGGRTASGIVKMVRRANMPMDRRNGGK
jgi:hypothetical protein